MPFDEMGRSGSFYVVSKSCLHDFLTAGLTFRINTLSNNSQIRGMGRKSFTYSANPRLVRWNTRFRSESKVPQPKIKLLMPREFPIALFGLTGCVEANLNQRRLGSEPNERMPPADEQALVPGDSNTP
jgi:hypothetical protein